MIDFRYPKMPYRNNDRKNRRIYDGFEKLESRQLLMAASILDGYTDKWSYNPGETVELYLNGETSQTNVDLTIYNATLKPQQTFVLDHLDPQQATNDEPWKNGFGYAPTASYTIPHDMPSGIYFFGRPIDLRDHRGGNQIPFIVKDTDKQSDIVYLTSTNTANLYNEKGGESAYTQYPVDKTPVVSFTRPRNIHFRTSDLNRWMSQQDYDYRVIGDREMDDYAELAGSRLLIIAGHNEYWTVAAKDNFDRFVQEGGEVLILGGNVLYRSVEYPTNDSIKVLGRNDFDDVLASIGLDYSWGGRGRFCGPCNPFIGYSGYKIVRTDAPFFENVDIQRGEILRMPFTSEYDGFPNLGLDGDDRTGFPIVDPDYSSHFFYFDLFGFDFAQLFTKPAPSRTLGGWIEFQHSPTAGRVLNVGATDWANDGFTGPDEQKLKTLTANMIDYLLDERHVQPRLGDFDFNHTLDLDDLQRLSNAYRSQLEPVWKYDITNDQEISQKDRLAWAELADLVWGDVNDDQRFDSEDITAVFITGEYNDGVPTNSTYADGDFNGDGEFDSEDFVFVFVAGTYESGTGAHPNFQALSVTAMTTHPVSVEQHSLATDRRNDGNQQETHQKSVLTTEPFLVSAFKSTEFEHAKKTSAKRSEFSENRWALVNGPMV